MHTRNGSIGMHLQPHDLRMVCFPEGKDNCSVHSSGSDLFTEASTHCTGTWFSGL